MVTTALMPLDPALSPQRIARVLTISANLLPDEIVAGRRARRSRTAVLVALGLVLLLLAGWYLRAEADRRTATKELDEVTTQTAATQRSQNKYQEVVQVRNETATLTKQLSTLMANDLPYATLFKTLRTTATAAKVNIEGVTAALNTAADKTSAAAGTTTTLPSESSTASIGTLVIVGSAPDKKSIAAFSDKLGGVAMIADPYVTSVTTASGKVSFSLSAAISSAAACGHYTTACTSTGGK